MELSRPEGIWGATAVSNREWADVFVPHLPNERSSLESKALFYVPRAYELLVTVHKLNKSQLSATSTENKGIGLPLAGRSAIGKVLEDKPVVYESAIGFINVANLKLRALGDSAELSTRDIVACVFRLRDAPDLLQALSVTSADIAAACGIRLNVVEAALARYRIAYADAHAIWSYLKAQKCDKKITGRAVETLTSRIDDFIMTEVRPTHLVAVKLVNDGYVYGVSNLRPAPPSGHPWAIITD